MVLDVDDGQVVPGRLIFPWPMHGGVNQQWFDHPATGTIRSRLDHNYCMDIIGTLFYFRIILCYMYMYVVFNSLMVLMMTA